MRTMRTKHAGHSGRRHIWPEVPALPWVSTLVLVGCFTVVGCNRVERWLLENSHDSACSPKCNHESGMLEPCECGSSECEDDCHEINANRPNAREQCLQGCRICESVGAFRQLVAAAEEPYLIDGLLLDPVVGAMLDCSSTCGYWDEAEGAEQIRNGNYPTCVRPDGQPSTSHSVHEIAEIETIVESGTVVRELYGGEMDIQLVLRISGSSARQLLRSEGFWNWTGERRKPNRLAFLVWRHNGPGFHVKEFHQLPEVPGEQWPRFGVVLRRVSAEWFPIRFSLEISTAVGSGYYFGASREYNQAEVLTP